MGIGVLCLAGVGMVEQVLALPEVRDAGVDRGMIVKVYGTLAVYGFAMAALNVGMVFTPRDRVWWTVHIVNLSLGILKCCCIPVAVPLLLGFLRREVRLEFGA